MTAFGFDFDHTLGVDNGLEHKALYAYADELGRPLPPDDPARRKQLDGLLALFRAGDITMDDALARFGKLIGARAIRTERWREICYDLVPQLVEPIDGARELLTTLHARGIPTAILTNGWTPLQQKKIAHALGDDALAMPVLVSDTINAIKPVPRRVRRARRGARRPARAGVVRRRQPPRRRRGRARRRPARGVVQLGKPDLSTGPPAAHADHRLLAGARDAGGEHDFPITLWGR